MIAPYLPDVNDEFDRRQEREDFLSEFETNEVPAYFTYLAGRGVEPETAVDMIDPPRADDGLPICTDPPAVADDGNEVYIWTRMYEEAF